MIGLFRKKKAYLIKWERNIYVPHVHKVSNFSVIRVATEVNETVVRANCEADATWKFLQGHNAKLEQIDVLDIKEVGYYG